MAEVRIQRGDAVIASFFNENRISFNVINLSSFRCIIDESVEITKPNPLQSYKTSSLMRRSFLELSPARSLRGIE